MASRTNSSRRTASARKTGRARRNHVLLLLLGVILAYASALPGEFVWSDREDILQAGHRIAASADVAAALTRTRAQFRQRDDGTVAADARGSWQPVTLLSLSLGWLAWGDCAFCFHLENLFWHALAALGLYILGGQLLSQRRHGTAVAFWAALLFAVHPLGVTSVAWIGGRSYLLAAVCSVWALVMFTRLQATSRSRRRHVKRWLIGYASLALFAFGSHESTYLLPLVVLLVAAFEATQRGRGAITGIAVNRRLALLITLLVLAAVWVWRGLFIAWPEFAGSYPSDSLLNNAGTTLRHFWYYVQQVLIPSEPVVSDAWPVTLGWGAIEGAALLGFVALLAITGLLLSWRIPAGLGLAWFLLWILPGSGVFPTERFHQDQYAYLASWGLLFALSYAAMQAWRPIGRQLIAGSEALVFGPVVLVLLIVTAFSNLRWWDQERLFESELNSDPHYIEGRMVLARHALENGRSCETLGHVVTAIKAQRDRKFTGYWQADAAYALLAAAQLDLALHEAALRSVEQAIEARPSSDRLRHLRARILTALAGCDEAAGDCQATPRQCPDQLEVQADLGVILVAQKSFEHGHELLAPALTAGLGKQAHHRAMALVLIDREDWPGAATQLQQALGLREDPVARARLAWVNWRMGRAEAARAHLATAMQNPNPADPYVLQVAAQINETPAPAAVAEP